MILIWEEIGEGLLPVSQKLRSSLLRHASERQISSLRWAPGAAFRNPWKPDLPCLSGSLPHDLVMGGISCAGSRQWVYPKFEVPIKQVKQWTTYDLFYFIHTPAKVLLRQTTDIICISFYVSSNILIFIFKILLRKYSNIHKIWLFPWKFIDYHYLNFIIFYSICHINIYPSFRFFFWMHFRVSCRHQYISLLNPSVWISLIRD